MSAEYVRKPPSELAYSWPAIPFALAIPMVLIYKPLAWVLLVGAFIPCGLIRDWRVRRYERHNDGSGADA